MSKHFEKWLSLQHTRCSGIKGCIATTFENSTPFTLKNVVEKKYGVENETTFRLVINEPHNWKIEDIVAFREKLHAYSNFWNTGIYFEIVKGCLEVTVVYAQFSRKCLFDYGIEELKNNGLLR